MDNIVKYRKYIVIIGLIVILLVLSFTIIYTLINNSNNPDNVSNGVLALSDVVSTPVSPGSYQEYSIDKLTLNKDKKQILFYYASWCPTCRILDNELNNNLDKIPNDVIIYKVDYDSDLYNQMKRNHGVTYQHTLVYIDENGELIKKWAGSETLEDILNNINSI